MPIHSCTLPSGTGWKWGGSGKCYPSREGAEKQAEAAHANGFTGDAAVMAAGIAYIDPDGNVLLLKRSEDSDHPGEYCLPGGHIDEGETADEAARRESGEEIGYLPDGELEQIAQLVSDEGVDFTTFGYNVDEQFAPTLNDEHTDYIWAPVKKLPKSTHPGVKAALTQDCDCDSCKTKRTNDSVTASGFFAVEQLGPKQSFTPEGYLLCEEVPIARTGTQDYADIELPDIEPGDDGLIQVERDEDVVFAPDTIASFLGKSVTLDHPRSPVTPDNWSYLTKGTAHNIRRGEGEQNNLLLADLLITDKGAINEIRNNGLKEISCGYDSDYEQIAPGRARQTTIVGNHVALVKNARCGPVCSVQDSSKVLTGDNPMAVKKGATSFADKMRKLFMARDSEGFEKALSEEVKDEGMEAGEGQHIHIHMPSAAEPVEATKDDESEADPMAKVMTALDGLAKGMADIGERVSALESAGATKDSDEEKEKETKDDDGDGDGDDGETMDSDEEKKDDEKKTYDSAALRDEFQDAKARAEILAPGVKLPTFDSKLEGKKTADSICVLRRRALKTALTNDNADIVKSVVGNADVSKMPCGIAAMAFNAASEMVKAKNKAASTRTTDSKETVKKDINQIHADFWASRKA